MANAREAYKALAKRDTTPKMESKKTAKKSAKEEVDNILGKLVSSKARKK